MVADALRDAVDEYRKYLERFDQVLGTCEFGTYMKHHGRLIKKLTYDEFEPRWHELAAIEQAYEDVVARGDTINDVLVKVLRERRDELLVERPV
jgi:hypothetical protein